MNSTLRAREDLAQRVTAEATRRGVPAEDLLNQIVEAGLASLPLPLASGEKLTPPQKEASHTSPTLALFAQWKAEDPIRDEADREERQRDGDALAAALRNNRFTLRTVHLPETEGEEAA